MKKYKPYKKSYLNVSDGHKIYYELYGNPKGIPILYLHGGPGAGIKDKYKRFFNKTKHNVILFDQRGSGKSTPYASIKNNSTKKIIQDINQLLDHLNIPKVVLFGGSWGSTLALVYAITNPKRVKSIIIWGTFLGSKKAINYFLSKEMRKRFPQVYDRFISMVPVKYQKSLTKYYLSKMKSKDKRIARKFAYEWILYEVSLIKLDVDEKEFKKDLKGQPYKALAILEAHYFVNNCFLSPNFILKNAHKIKVPTSIIHGYYDFLCAPSDAYELHKKIKKSRFIMVKAGHGASEPEMDKALKNEVKKL